MFSGFEDGKNQRRYLTNKEGIIAILTIGICGTTLHYSTA
jgi:threonine dehydrogenase-like Zn-dependent dehydrogenase